MLPGDMIMVPTKAFGGGFKWRETLEVAQLVSAVGTACAGWRAASQCHAAAKSASNGHPQRSCDRSRGRQGLNAEVVPDARLINSWPDHDLAEIEPGRL